MCTCTYVINSNDIMYTWKTFLRIRSTASEMTVRIRGCFLVLVLASQLVHGHWSCNHHTPDLIRHVDIDGPSYSEHNVRKRAIDQRFRIFVHYDNSVSQLESSVRDRLQVIVNNLTAFYETSVTVRATQGPILLDRACTGRSIFVFPVAPKKRCTTTCSETTICGLVTIPEEHLKACSQCNGNETTCETIGSDGPGVNNTDFVLYVSSINPPVGCSGNTIAFAGACQMEAQYDRPIAGHVNFCPGMISGAMTTDAFIEDVAKHELLHALAFSSGLYPFWRNSSGAPRTPRDNNDNPPRDNNGRNFVASSDTVRVVTYDNWQTRNGPVSHNVTLLVTPAVVREGRVHFNCSTLEGVELENQGGSGTALSHWEKRILNNELMTGAIAANSVLSRLTLAVLEDSGWYTVNYSKAEQLVWGRGSGCGLSTGSCGGYIQDRLPERSPSPFCNRLQTSPPQRQGCTLDRTALSLCNLQQLENALPAEYQYLNTGENFDMNTIGVDLSRLGGKVALPDYCPYQQGFSNGDCSIVNNKIQDVFAETYGESSRCVLHNGTWTVNGNTVMANSFGSGCYQYTCINNQVTLFVLGNQYTCSSDGQIIDVDVSAGGTRYRGSLICPSCLEICYDDFANCDAAAELYSDFVNGSSPIIRPNFTAIPTPSTDSQPTDATSPSTASHIAVLFGPLILLLLITAIMIIH